MENIKKIFSETKKIADTFEGWLTKREEKFLFLEAVKSNPKGCILEIGSWQGKSTTFLVRGASLGKNKNKIYAMDPHIGSIEHKAELKNKSSLSKFRNNIRTAKIVKKIVLIVEKSQDFAKKWKQPISFLWIDGDHSYQCAKADFDLYLKYVIDSGTIAFHDSTQNDVPKVVYESFKKPGICDIGLVDSIAYAKFKRNRKKSLKDYFVLYLIKFYPTFRMLKIFKPFKNTIKKAISKI